MTSGIYSVWTEREGKPTSAKTSYRIIEDSVTVTIPELSGLSDELSGDATVDFNGQMNRYRTNRNRSKNQNNSSIVTLLRQKTETVFRRIGIDTYEIFTSHENPYQIVITIDDASTVCESSLTFENSFNSNIAIRCYSDAGLEMLDLVTMGDFEVVLIDSNRLTDVPAGSTVRIP